MNDPLLDTIQEKPRLFKQIEVVKKEATFPVENAIKGMKSSPNDLCQRALELGNNWSEEVKMYVEAGHLHEARQFLDAVNQTLGPSDQLAYWQRVLAKTKVLPGTPASGVGDFANVAWLRQHSRPYYGQWIALREGVLLGANESRSALRQQLKDSGTHSGAVFIKVGGQ